MRERDLLRHIYAQSQAMPDTVTIPPGDDMGAVMIDSAQVLIAVDQVVDGVHVDTATMPLEKIARKAITRNLSDIAAMAAMPVAAVVAGCLPHDMGQDRANRLFDAMRDIAMHYDCPLIGGDIAMWDQPMVLSVTVLARCAPGQVPTLRSGSREGDIICVSGQLGGSLETIDGHTHHLDFEPRIRLARALAEHGPRPHAMIDLSDGLTRDLTHLCEAADLRAEVWVERLPISPAAVQVSQRSGRQPWHHAAADGEDYELCFTVSAEAFDDQGSPIVVEDVTLTPIGRMIRAGEGPTITWLRDGEAVVPPEGGWEHGRP